MFINDDSIGRNWSSNSSEGSDLGNDTDNLIIDNQDINFVSSDESDSPELEPITDDLKVIHELGVMGFSMETVLKAIDTVKSTDVQTVIDQILSTG